MYAHINDKSNPHRVTAKQIGAATQESLDALSDTMFGGTFVETVNLEPEVLRILEEHDISGGGGITEEEVNEMLDGYATIDYVETALPAIVDNEIRNQYEPIAEFVISQLPIYNGEVV